MVRGPCIAGWLSLYGLNPAMLGVAWREAGKLDTVAFQGTPGVMSGQVILRSLMCAVEVV